MNPYDIPSFFFLVNDHFKIYEKLGLRFLPRNVLPRMLSVSNIFEKVHFTLFLETSDFLEDTDV